MSMRTETMPTSSIADINTTPLIDVMLVLLIMISSPVATKIVTINLPKQGEPRLLKPDPVKNKGVVNGSGKITWNGQPVSQSELAGLPAQTTRMPVESELRFEPEAAASYDLDVNVLDSIKSSGVTRSDFVGNDRFEAFTK